MDLYNVSNGKLSQIDRDDFGLEKEIQTIVEGSVSELFGLQFISSEFQIESFRLDTLCYDEEQKAFVIIEYKKGSSYSVIDQGYSYLSVLLNNKADFILEYNETQDNSLKKAEVEWENSRIIFISQSFNTYQKNSVNFKDVPFELWQIQRFKDGIISFDQHFSRSQESIKTVAQKDQGSVMSRVSSEIGTFSEDDHVQKASEDIRKVWEAFKSKASEHFEINYIEQKYYVGLKKRSKLVTVVRFFQNKLELDVNRGNIKLDKSKSKGFFSFDDAKKICKEKSWKYKSGIIGNSYGITLSNLEEIDYIIYLLRQKYDSL